MNLNHLGNEYAPNSNEKSKVVNYYNSGQSIFLSSKIISNAFYFSTTLPQHVRFQLLIFTKL